MGFFDRANITLTDTIFFSISEEKIGNTFNVTLVLSESNNDSYHLMFCTDLTNYMDLICIVTQYVNKDGSFC